MLPSSAFATSFTLLDDVDASPEFPSSRLYTGLQQVLTCTTSAEFSHVMDHMQQLLQQGVFAVAVFSYELGGVLQGMYPSTEQPSQLLIYQHCQKLSRQQVSDWLQSQITLTGNDAGIAQLTASVTEAHFTDDIHRIQAYIAAGDAYQVNYTYRYHFTTYGELCALYQRLRERQPVPFGAVIVLPDGSGILSLSPELFVHHHQGQLLARPMKGTAAASVSSNVDVNNGINAQRAADLAADSKNRAENVMIVDLLRNDLGRIAVAGSVRVPQLFNVQQFSSVLQMTSSVVAQVRPEVTLSDVIRALYPCGSITGAPKYRTMQLIAELETTSRGIYTGAIGWFDPPDTVLEEEGNKEEGDIAHDVIPDFCLSVPIRTLQLQAPSNTGERQATMGVGAGIVFDSVARDEYQECQLKARFLTGMAPQFSLFETMHVSREEGEARSEAHNGTHYVVRHLERHLARLFASAAYFGIVVSHAQVRHHIAAMCQQLVDEAKHNHPFRMKLSVDGVGQIQIQHALLAPLVLSASARVRLLLAPTLRQSTSMWLRHKTSNRAVYDAAWQEAEQCGAFDMVFFNERGELTEGGRSNVLVNIGGRWFTPPLSSGVLPGIMRSVLMDDPEWGVTERHINAVELQQADAVAVCNALRGVMLAELVT